MMAFLMFGDLWRGWGLNRGWDLPRVNEAEKLEEWMGEELVEKGGWKVCGSRCFNQELNSGPLGWV